MPRPTVTTTSVGDIKALQRDFERSQRAARRPPRTIGTYREGIDQLAAFLDGAAMPTSVAAIRREHVEAFMDALNARTKPATASNRFRGLVRLTGWGGRDMLARYARRPPTSEPRETHRRLSPSDRL